MRSFYIIIALLFLVTGPGFVSADNQPVGLQVSKNYVLVSKKRIGRTVFEYIYKAKIINVGSTRVSGGIAQVKSRSRHTIVKDGQISFAPILARSSILSSDTFTISHNRLFKFNPKDLTWKISLVSIEAPVADAGKNINALLQSTTKVDGSSSYDPTNKLLAYKWLLKKKPTGSQAILIGATLPNPGIIPDVAGDYVVSLVVNNGLADSTVDEVTIKAFATVSPPNANAGAEINALRGQGVTLDGSQSDDPNGIGLTYQWLFSAIPPASRLSNTDLSFADSPNPKFTPDVEGRYGLTLKAVNGSLIDDDTVKVIAMHPKANPNANAGLDFSAKSDIVLNGSASNDPDNAPRPLKYQWDFVAKPLGSLLTSANIQNRTAAKASFKPDKEGAYVLRLTVSDGENLDSDNVLVMSDHTAPDIQFVSPQDNSVIATTKPTFNINLSDSGSGIDKGTFKLTVNGVDVTANTSVSDTLATYTVAANLSAGVNKASATVADLVGNVKTLAIDFTIAGFRALADCNPKTGNTPLTVLYRSKSESSGTSVVNYAWDFDGNGTFDTSDSVANDYTRTWTTAGTIVSKLQVTNNLGQTATDTCTVKVGGNSPAAVADVSPSNGPVPLNVGFSCIGSDSDGSIAKYEWDFDGNGSYDYSSTSSGTTTHTYSAIGTNVAVCRVTDNAGLTGTARTTTTTIRPAVAGSPTVTGFASPSSGNAPLLVNFSGSAVDDGTIKLWEWDFDGDGTYDFSSPTSATASFTYTKAGVFAPALRVTDNDNKVGIDSVEVIANIAATLTITDETFEPSGTPNTGTIKTTLSAGVPVKLIIKNQNAQVIRTLVEATRSAGNYSDVWDGKNDAGELVAEGVYYAVLEYDFSGETRSVDLTNTTGGNRYNPPRTGIPGTFAPLAGQPLVIDFTLSRASEVTAFIGRFNVDTRLLTFYDRLPFGKGTHRIVWNGENADGQLIHPPSGDRFLFGIWGYSLPNNALFVKNSPQLSELTITPSILVPSNHPDANGNAKQSIINFKLNKTADVELIVYDAVTGDAFARRLVANLPSGANTVRWDARDDNGTFVAPGKYRLGLTAIDSAGHRSMRLYGLQRIYY